MAILAVGRLQAKSNVRVASVCEGNSELLNEPVKVRVSFEVFAAMNISPVAPRFAREDGQRVQDG